MQKLMNTHLCVFKILETNQSVTDRHTGGRTDNVKSVYPTTNKVCGGGINITFWLEYFISCICYVSYVGNVWLGSLASIDVFRSVGRSPTSQPTKQIFFFLMDMSADVLSYRRECNTREYMHIHEHVLTGFNMN